jgi:hypothetical protein
VLGDETLESLFNPVRLREVWTAIKSLSKLPPLPPLFVSIFQNSERRQPKECAPEVLGEDRINRKVHCIHLG